MSPRLLAVVGALGAAAVTNLVAVVVLESYATTDQLRTGLLIGVNLGVGLTPTASLATVLWADSLRRAGHRPPLRAYLTIGGGLSVVLVGVTPLLL